MRVACAVELLHDDADAASERRDEEVSGERLRGGNGQSCLDGRCPLDPVGNCASKRISPLRSSTTDHLVDGHHCVIERRAHDGGEDVDVRVPAFSMLRRASVVLLPEALLTGCDEDVLQ